jgi:glutamine synthetase
VASGIDGIARKLDPGPPAEEPYLAKDRTPLPASLMDAVAALRADPFFTDAFGAPFVDYFTRIKEFEIGRFLQHVTDWEHREYFEVF